MEIDEVMRWASACAAAGDRDGELEAYRRADELGDAQAAIFLGNMLRRNGEAELARKAYERAESRGHREAAMSLGNLLQDIGEHESAEAAYLRSIRAGSTIASLNLGLMLAEQARFDEALPHLQRAADAGEVGGFWGVGKVQEQRGNRVAAIDAYRGGSHLGDPTCSYGLGVVLYEQGDHEAAKAAFQTASDQGHEGAKAVLQAFERESEHLSAGEERPSIGQLWQNVTNLYDVLARQRQKLGKQWIASTLLVQDEQEKLSALKEAHAQMSARLSSIIDRFKPTQPPPVRAIDSSLPRTPEAWLGFESGRPRIGEPQTRAFEADIEQARVALLQAETKKFSGGLRQTGADALGRAAQRLEGLRTAVGIAEQAVRRAEAARDLAAEAEAVQCRSDLDAAAHLASTSSLALPVAMQPWSSPVWKSFNLEAEMALGMRLAYVGDVIPKPDSRLGPNAGFGTHLHIPWALSPHDSWSFQHDGPSRASAHGFIRSMMLRHLLLVQPGDVRFCVFDPVGLGQSAGELLELAEYDADLIGGKVWTAPQDLEIRLGELSAHIELVIQKYLRTTYQSIQEFNEAAGDVAEPFRVLVLFDCPTGLTAESASRLKSIVENGPRCGVYTLIALDGSLPRPYGLDVDHVLAGSKRLHLQAGFAMSLAGYNLEADFEHDELPTASHLGRRIVDHVGRASIGKAESAVGFESVFSMYRKVVARGLRPELGVAAIQTDISDAATWWSDESTRGLFAPIGQKGARDVAILGFDSSDHAGALLVGRPGSGKSTLLHTYIGGLTTLYGPDELDLYLIDFKEGVEFKAYAEEQLPHAKVIAIESDREFGLSVLESLQAEIARRAEVLRATGGRQAGMQALRESTHQKIPRVLLVFDEFQVLFARNDKVGLAAADLLESIIRQGRGFGVHVLLGSQSLSGLDALGAHVPQLLPVRILLPAADSDARRVLGDNNNAGEFITSRGEGVLNAAGGAVEANERFRGALLPEPERVARLKVMRRKADELGFRRVPMVFEGNSLVALADQSPHQFGEEMRVSGVNPIRLRCGAPMTVGEVGDITLRREGGANVLAILRGGTSAEVGATFAEGSAYGLLVAAVSAAAMTNASIDIIDFMANDDGLDGILEPLLNARRIGLRRRRALPDLLNDYAAEVLERVEQDEASRPAKVLFLFGVHRARDLDSEMGTLDVDLDLVETLERIMRDGPEVGVHVWMWADSVAGASRRLTPRMMRELGWRVAGKMSSDDSHTLIGAANASDLRDNQLLIVNEDYGVATRVTAYAPPPPQWLAQLIQLTTRHE